MNEKITTPSTWPDPQREGEPLNPDADGFHVVSHRLSRENLKFPVRWCADERVFYNGETLIHPYSVKADWIYHGPMRTDADLATTASVREAAGATVMQQAALAALRDEALGEPDNDEDAAYNSALGHAEQSIRALPIPNASALEAVLEQARREEREACARVADDLDCGRTHSLGVDGRLMARRITAAIRGRKGI